MTPIGGLGDLIARRLTRRGLFRVGGTGAATALIVGLGQGTERAHAAPPRPALAVDALRRVDPHALTARTLSFAAEQGGAPSLRILPLSRAKFLAGGRFDLRVEAQGVDPQSARIEIAVSGPNGPEPVLRGEPDRSSPKEGTLAVTYSNTWYDRPGRYTVTATLNGDIQASVSHEAVVATSDGKKAKNVIFFLGDGMGQAPITAARILSRGITEGRYNGLLEMDRMDYRGLVTTSGADSIATDSANSMSAYMTGHKSSVNAMGVYEGSDPDPNKHPRVETIAELLRRARGMAIGVVTTAEVQDATPAAVWAHTRRRSEYAEIMDQALKPGQMPDVLMGGGSASLLPQSQEGSKRKDDRDLVKEFQAEGFAWAASRGQLNEVLAGGIPGKLLGLFHLGHMNVYLDRQHFKNPLAPNSQGMVTPQFDDQPTLWEMTSAALDVLSKDPKGFFLMVEGASIDKMEHPLDWPRAVYDTIEMDKALGVAKRWAEQRGDTLIVVTADHNHSMSIVGTNDRAKGGGRRANGVYADAGFPNFVDSDGDGFLDTPDPDRTLFIGWSNHPDHFDDFRLNGLFEEPTLLDRAAPGGPTAVANPAKDGGSALQTGNLDFSQTNCVHTVEDVPIMASGPGAARFNGVLDNTEVFFAMMDALGLDARASVPSPVPTA